MNFTIDPDRVGFGIAKYSYLPVLSCATKERSSLGMKSFGVLNSVTELVLLEDTP